MKGLKLRTIVGMFCLVLCGAGVLVAHVWKQNEYVRLSMATVKIGRQRTELRNDIAALEISVSGLKTLSRLEGVAKSRFGLEYGKPPVLVYLARDSKGSRRALSEAADRSASEAADRSASEAADRSASEAADRSASEAAGLGLEAGKVAWRIDGF